MTSFESIGILTEIGKLLVNTWNAVSYRKGFLLKGGKYRVLSLHMTVEFSPSDGSQLAESVTEKRYLITRNDAILPANFYWSEGQFAIDELRIGGMPVRFKQTFSAEGRALITPEKEVSYSKGDLVDHALLSHSINGFLKSDEDFQLRVDHWILLSRVEVIFPPDKKPNSFTLVYREPSDPPGISRNPAFERCELRPTTRGRWALSWESKNLRPGRVYTILWKWAW